MAVTTPSSRRPAVVLGASVLVAALLVAGCSSSKADTASGSSSTTSAPTPSVTAGGSSSTTSGSDTRVGSPSTLPAAVAGPCAALAETLGLNEIRPKNTSSWPDERQRILVDAQREADLLGAAQQGAPADIATDLATMQAFANWIVTTVSSASGFSQVSGAIDAYPNLVPASLAVATVTTWRKANCPQ